MAYQDLYTNYGAVNSMFSPEEDTSINAQSNVAPTSDTVTPVTQTLKIDPMTGEQKMTISGRPEDLSAANPYTPTVTMPGQGLRMPAQPQAQGIQMPQPNMTDVAMPAFQAPAPQVAAQAPQAPATPATPKDQMAEDVFQQLRQNLAQPQPAAAPMAPMATAPATSDMAPPAVPVAPPAPQVTAPAAPAPVAPTAPVATPAAGSPEYNQTVLAELRKREGNYDSPAHPLSSARGAYGITAPAYSDIQRADPYFAQRDQATLNPADQDRAALVLRGLNQERLRAQGVEPTEANQQLAHFLGPKGAADYLATGYISDAAAAANGGLNKTRQIAEERLALGRQLSGQTGPAVAGVSREMGMGEPGYGGAADQINDLASRGDRQGLANMYGQQGLTGRAAGLLLNQQMSNDQKEEAARNRLRSALETGDQRDLFGMLKTASKKSEEGNWLTYLITGLLGMEGPNKREADKLGLNDKVESITLPDGTAAMIQTRNGRPVAGITEEGLMSQKELLAAGVGVGGGKTKPDVSTQDVQKGDLKGRVVTTYDRNNRPTTFVESGGRRYAYDSSWTPVSVGTAATKAEQAAAIKLRYAGPTAFTESGAKFAGEFNAKYGTNIGYATQAPGAPLMDLNTGKIVTPDANGNISATQSGVPGTSAAGGAGTGARPPAVVAGMTKSNQEYSDKLANDKATAGSQKSTISRIQSSIDRNPEFWGIDTNSPTWRAFVDVNSTNADRSAALNTLARNLNINPDKRADFDQTMNDYRNLQVNAITGSGLSASQTNTEKEGERVIGTIGSIGDKPAAAKATLEFARAKIEYTEAKARAWIEARRKNPGLDRLEFEDTFDQNQGEKIFADVNKRMEKILEDARKKQTGATSTGTTAERPLTPQDLARQELERRRKEKQ